MKADEMCAICGLPATHQCNSHLGNWGCGAPLCDRHGDDDHHPEEPKWREYKACGLVKSQIEKGAKVDDLWYAFMDGYRAGRG